MARARDAEALARAGALLSSVLDPTQVYEIALDQLATLIPYDHALMLICDGTWARFVAGRGTGQLPAGTPVIDLEGTGGAALLALDGAALYIADTLGSPTWHDFPLWAGEHRIRSAIIVPLVSDGSMLACLCLASFAERAFTQRQSDLASQFAYRASQAIRNARLYRAALDHASDSSHFDPGIHQSVGGQRERRDGHLTPFTSEVDSLDESSVADGPFPERQEQVVDNLRLLSLLDAGSLVVAAQTVAVRSLVQRAIKLAPAAVRDRQISMQGPEDVLAFVDPQRANEIVGNLLDNAVRYSAGGSPIAMTWGVEDSTVVIRIRDQGHGISSQNRRFLFTRFGWMPGTQSRRAPKGIGVGLYLGRSVAELMGGGLELEASSPKGSLFRLWFPVPPD
jgi:GAF domain-containing protein